MSSRLKLLAVFALALITGIVSLVATATGESDRGGKVQIIDLTTRTVQEAQLDLAEKGPSVGDHYVFGDDVFRGDKKVGVGGGECTVLRLEPSPLPAGQEPTSAISNCVATVQLPKGQVTLQGLVASSEQAGNRFSVAITGGTGAYRTAHGEATVVGGEEPEGLQLKLIR